METLRRTAFVAAYLLITGSVVSAQTSVSIGVQIGPPPPPRVVYVAPPPPPQPEYVWVEGYWYPVDRHYVWHDGYYTRPPYPGARWISARYDRNMYYAGYWQGPSGVVVVHDHRWDGDHDRDFRGNPGRGRGRGRGHY